MNLQAPQPRIADRPPSAAPPIPFEIEAPLLIDVTPLSLSVETVGGYCDVIIDRNTPVPCDRTRVFVTARTNQEVVRVRVAQGESKRFLENTVLGELELSGLRQAARGEVQVAVSFVMDPDGILQVKALDVGTGRKAEAKLRLVSIAGLPAEAEMRARQDRQKVG